MSIQSSSKIDDPTIVTSLMYQFHFPAIHRNFKSLVYGDMNMIDWTNQDLHPSSMPTFDQLQLRYATPAYSMFKMLARSAPGGKSSDESYQVYQLQEALVGPAHVYDPVLKKNIYRSLERDKFYAYDGGKRGNELKTLTVKVGDRLHIYVLNLEPASVYRTFYVGVMNNNFKTAVVRETSIDKRDMPTEQITLKDGEFGLKLAAESLTEIIFTQEDLSKIGELKIEQCPTATNSVDNLSLLQTTRLKTFGKYEDRWIDLTELNVVWSAAPNSGLNIYHGGLLQRMKKSTKAETVSAKTLSGVAAKPMIVKPVQ